MKWPTYQRGNHNLWRGEDEARRRALALLNDEHRGYGVSEEHVALLIEVIYPIVAGGVLSKAMTIMRDLGDRRFTSDALDALDLMRKRWTGLAGRSRP